MTPDAPSPKAGPVGVDRRAFSRHLQDEPYGVFDLTCAMLRLSIRFIGLLILAAAFAALVVDGTRSLAAGTPDILPLGRTASVLFPSGFDKFHLFVATHAPSLWNPVMVTILLLPAWAVLGVVGLLLLAVTRRRAPKIGYSRR